MNSRILVGFRATEDTPKKPEQGNRKNSAQQRPRSGHSVILQHLSKWALRVDGMTPAERRLGQKSDGKLEISDRSHELSSAVQIRLRATNFPNLVGDP